MAGPDVKQRANSFAQILRSGAGALRFHPADPITDEEMDDVLVTIVQSIRVCRTARRRGPRGRESGLDRCSGGGTASSPVSILNSLRQTSTNWAVGRAA